MALHLNKTTAMPLRRGGQPFSEQRWECSLHTATLQEGIQAATIPDTNQNIKTPETYNRLLFYILSKSIEGQATVNIHENMKVSDRYCILQHPEIIVVLATLCHCVDSVPVDNMKFWLSNIKLKSYLKRGNWRSSELPGRSFKIIALSNLD